MNKKIDINVTGGNLNIGNISQGNRSSNSVSDQKLSQNAEADLSAILKHIDRQAKAMSVSDEQVASLKAEIDKLKEAYRKNDPSLLSAIEGLYKKYSWAADAIKNITSIFIV